MPMGAYNVWLSLGGMLGITVVIVWDAMCREVSNTFLRPKSRATAMLVMSAVLFLPLLAIFASPALQTLLGQASMGRKLATLQASVYALAAFCILVSIVLRRSAYGLSIRYCRLLSTLSALGALVYTAVAGLAFFCAEAEKHAGVLLLFRSSGPALYPALWSFVPLLILMLAAGGVAVLMAYQQLDNTTSDTTGHFGSAAWMTLRALEKQGAYDPRTGPFVGTDEKGRALYFPLVNKLTLSPPGGGKTSASSIPVLLSHDGPVFVFDVKGELWAVTARHRATHFKRNIVLIDPYGVTQRESFQQGKPDNLLTRHTCNPFDWIPEDPASRDRMMNAFAASFVVQEGRFAAHFDENAKILIRGYIDYIMGLPKPQRSLATLYRLMTESSEDAESTLTQMRARGGRAGAAAQQLARVGGDERGSILSTSYRQLDWLGDSNMQHCVATSSMDLSDFVRGDLDIFVVLPEDQVKEQSRLVRMLLSLLMGLLVHTDPTELPKKKSLFLLEELAQLGYCPDVEQCIEVLRARGVVVWTVFQTLSQIQQFKKPDLFKGAPCKQIFTTDDTDTLQWIQTLGGKKTILTKTWSAQQGNSQQKTHAFRGTFSSTSSESIHETASDLIPLDVMRTLPVDEQLIFYHGAPPLRIKKVRYFESPVFTGQFDPNPLEKGG